MNEEEMMEVGARAEALLRDPAFTAFSAGFEHETATKMLSTKPHEKDEREQYFSLLVGHRAFISYLADAIDTARKLHEKNEPQPVADDLDDPSVHNIYY